MDKISLQVPKDDAFLPLLHMVLGGIGLRHDLSFDALDDVQLAVDNILAEDDSRGGELTVDVVVGDTYLDISLGALRDRDLEYMLRQGEVPPGAEDRCIDVCVLLRSLVDDYKVRDLGDGLYAVDIRKVVR